MRKDKIFCDKCGKECTNLWIGLWSSQVEGETKEIGKPELELCKKCITPLRLLVEKKLKKKRSNDQNKLDMPVL